MNVGRCILKGRTLRIRSGRCFRFSRSGHDSRAAAGFFEDIPALIVVTIGLGIFIASVAAAIRTYVSYSATGQFIDEGFDFCQAVRSYQEILDNGTFTGEIVQGRFSPDKLDNMTTARMKQDIHTHHYFNVTITEYVDYNWTAKTPVEGRTWHFGEETNTKFPQIKTSQSAVVIIRQINVINIGTMQTAIWGDGGY